MDHGDIAARVVLTPAERAVMVEQAEAAVIELRIFIDNCQTGTSEQAVKTFLQASQRDTYIHGLINQKVQEVVARDHMGGGLG